MKKTFYITTPIYYPSGSLHIGHVYTTTLAWTLMNFKKLNGYDTKFLTGADEHGEKIESIARKKGISPKIYVDKMSMNFKNLWKKLGIEYDYFSRTTNKKHMQIVQDIFKTLLKEKIIYKGYYKGLYSISDEEFFTKIQAKQKGDKYYHPLSGNELKEIQEESYFFKMSQFSKWLISYYLNNPNFVIPNKVLNELKNNFLDKGLEDLSITRNTFAWGIPMKKNSKHIIYVWFEALNNYITALGYQTKQEQDFIKYWKEGDEIVHIVGKEIARFHCIYWPIILKTLKIRQPTSILSHGWIITPEGKMSKSKGNVVDPIKLIKKYGAEVVKYFFASQINIGQDGTFDEKLLKKVYNANLANNFGNLLQRTITMINQNFDGIVCFKQTNKKEDKLLLKTIVLSQKKYIDEFNNYQINKALKISIDLSKKLNGYIDITRPWKLTSNKKRLEIVLNNLLNGIYAVATMLSVVMPKNIEKVFKQININELNLDLITDFSKFNNIKINKGNVLFKRLK